MARLVEVAALRVADWVLDRRRWMIALPTCRPPCRCVVLASRMGWAEGADRKGIVAAGWRGPVRFCQTPDLTLCPLDGGHDARTDRHVWTIDGKTVFTAFVDVPGIDALAAGILRGAGGVRGSLGCLRAPARLRHGRLSFSVHAA